MLRKGSLVILVLTLSFIFLGWQPGAGAKSVKIAYFSLEEVMAKSKVGQEAQRKFKAEEKKIRAELQKKTTELENLKKELEKKSKLLSKEAREKKAKEFFEKKKAWEQFTLKSKMKLSRLSNKMSAPIIEDILAIAKKIGEKEGYTVIFEVQRAGIAYAQPQLDITDRIVKELDKMARKK